MIQKIQRDFLLLFQCIIDFGAEVLRDFIMKKIKTNYSCDDFTSFLKDEKHYFYHQWEKNKIACCECPASGCTLPKTKKVRKTLFDKLYIFDTSIKWPKGHGKWKNSEMTQKCICLYNASAITIQKLDLSDLYNTLVNTRIITIISESEKSLISEIMTVRGSVCHALETTTFSETELRKLWNAFTDALYTLFPGDSKWVRIAVEQSKTKILSEDDVHELMKKIGITSTEVQDISDTIINSLDNQTTEIKTCINESLQPITGQLNQQSKELSDLKSDNRKFAETLIGMLGKQPIRAEMNPEQLELGTPENSDSQKIKISIKLELSYLTTEDEYNVTRNLTSTIEIPVINERIVGAVGKETITVMATKVDSIILELQVTPGILKSVDILRLAIITLVQHVHIAAKTDTNLEDTVTVNFKFVSPLTKDQIAVVKCMFSKDWNDDNNDEQLSDEHSSTANVANIDLSTEPESYSQQGLTAEINKLKDLKMENSQLKEVVEDATATSLVKHFQDDIGMISKTGKLGMKQKVSKRDDFSSLVSEHTYGLHNKDIKLRDLSSKTIVDECRNCFEKDEIIIQLDRRLCEIRRRVIEAKKQSVSGNIVFEDLLQFIHQTTNMTSVEEKERMTYKELKSGISSKKSELISDVDVRDPEKKANKKVMESQASQGRRPELDQTEEKTELSLRISEIRREYASNYYTKTDKQKGLGIILQTERSRYSPLVRDHLQEFFDEKGFIVKCTDENNRLKLGEGGLWNYMTDEQFYCVFIVMLGDPGYRGFYNDYIIQPLLSQGVKGKPVIIMTDVICDVSDMREDTADEILIVMPISRIGRGRDPYGYYREKNIFDDFVKATRRNRFADIMDILTQMNALYDISIITFQSSLRKKFCFL